MKLSIIIPVYNEEKTITSVLENIIKVIIPWDKEIIIVDDGSTDGTREKILRYLEIKKLRIKESDKNTSGITKRRYIKLKRLRKSIKVIRHTENLGKGAAVRSGIKVATGDYILIQDADLEYNPEEIPKLLTPLLSQPTTDNRLLTTKVAVYGSRFKDGNPPMPKLYLLGNKFLTKLTNILYKTSLTDMETGYKLLPTSYIKKIKLNCHRFNIEPEITAKLIKKGIRIIEIPISYKGRSHIAGKKLTVKDALEAITTLFIHKLG